MRTILNQLVYFAFFQSIFLLCIYLFSAKKRKNINGYVAFLVFVLLIGLSGRILYISEIFGKDHRLIAFSEFANMLFGSTIFLFTKSALWNKRFSYQDLVHYIPGLFYGLFVIFYFMLPHSEAIAVRIESGELTRTVTLFIGVALLFNITYWALSLQQFLKFRKNLNDELSYTIKTQFFFNFLIAIGLCLLSWVIVYFISVFGFEMIERQARESIWLSIAFIILFITYYGMIAPDLFRTKSMETVRKYTRSRLTLADLDRLKARLEMLMEEKKPYLNSKLLKAELAEMLGVSNPELARLLNENIGMNFFEYVNYYRVKEFVILARTDKAKNLTFYGIAQEAGFNSKTTFNKSFKKLMGTSPSNYFNVQNS